MGLFGSLFTGVSALAAQSQNTAMISNNIANVNTTGFKRSEAAFFSLVTTEGRATRYSPGTVTASRLQNVDSQGTITQTGSSTNGSIAGKGFFTVKRNGLDSALDEFLYTRNGQFSENEAGFLVNSAGFYLYGWPVDSTGAIQGGLTFENLQPVSVGFANGISRPTANASLSLNLDSREPDVGRTAALIEAPNYERTITVYDSQGGAQDLSFRFVKTYGPQATIAGSVVNLTATSDLIADRGLVDGDLLRFTIDGPATLTLEVDNDATVGGGNVGVRTIGDIIEAVNNAAGMSAYLGNNGELIVQRDAFVGGVETIAAAGDTTTFATNSTDTSVAIFGQIGPTDTSADLAEAALGYDNGTAADTPPYSSEIFPSYTNTDPAVDPNYNARGWWQMEVYDDNNNRITRGLINFNRDGSLNAEADDDGNVDLALNNIDWGNGTSLQNISVDIQQFSMFSSNYTTFFTDQDGAELGLRTGIAVNREGFIVAQFSNGATSELYKVPLATFNNPNGLQEVSGTAYIENDGSGTANLREAGTGGAGTIEPSTLENSNVDLADEFARLIVTQRAFGANTRVITTVDQMTEDLLRLR